MCCAVCNTLTAHTDTRVCALAPLSNANSQPITFCLFKQVGVALWDCSATGHSCQVHCGLQRGDMGQGLEVGIYLGPVWVVYSIFFHFLFFPPFNL